MLAALSHWTECEKKNTDQVEEIMTSIDVTKTCNANYGTQKIYTHEGKSISKRQWNL